MNPESDPSPVGMITRPFLPTLAGVLSGAQDGIALEFGSGDGRLAHVVPASLTWVGIDLNMDQQRGHAGAQVCGTIERLPFADESVETLFSFSVLQYVDAKKALAEARRVLHVGSTAVFFENLEGNPIARAYRAWERLTGRSSMRQHLRLDGLALFEREFHVERVETKHLLAPALFFGPLNRRVTPQRMRTVSERVAAIDRRALRVGLLRRWAWMAAIVVTKVDCPAAKQRTNQRWSHDQRPDLSP